MKKTIKRLLKKLLPYKIVRVENMSLTKQLVLITLVALVVSAISLCIVLPAILKPYYEANIYSHLEQPSKFIRPETNKMGEDIAFVIITKGGAIYTSNNLQELVPGIEAEELVTLTAKAQGTFKWNKETYYYLWGENTSTRNLIITDDRQLEEESNSLLSIIFPTMVATIAITVMLLVTWSQYILKKVKKLNKKTEGLITGEKVEGREFIVEDELSELYNTIEQVDGKLKEKDEYKNLMFQNLSHELKTPISVIQNYIEGVHDGMVEEKEAIRVISEETATLSNQVKTILQINKIDYMRDSRKYVNSKVDMTEVITAAVEKHKLIRSDIKFDINLDEKENIFNGTYEMWIAVLDNILGNFMRYAKSNISINLKGKEIIFSNDGEKIDESMLDKIFLPYVKGKKGQSGLGLSIAKKTVNIFGYDIFALNTENGVMFVIK